MSTSAASAGSTDRVSENETTDDPQYRQLLRWGGVAGVGGAVFLVGSAVTVGVFGLPDASDVETLTDFADIETGRIIEHFLYLGSLMLLALNVFVLHAALRSAHRSAALFGTVTAGFGLVIMAASSLLHVSTSPLADLYTDPDTPVGDLPAIEYAWYGAQSIFDTMLATGVLLVPIGIVLFGLAMRSAPAFGSGLTSLTFVLGIAGVLGAIIAVIVPGSAFSALSVLAIAVFGLSAGWTMLKLGNGSSLDLAG